MKRLIPFLFLILILTACADTSGVENPDRLSAAVMTASDSVTGENAYRGLNESAVATLTVKKIDTSESNLSDYDLLYIDRSAARADFDKTAVQ